MMADGKLTPILNGDDTDFYKQVADLLAASRQYAKRQLDSTITIAYFEVGRMIVEREQRGQKQQSMSAKSTISQIGQSLADLFKISWTHYQILMRVKTLLISLCVENFAKTALFMTSSFTSSQSCLRGLLLSRPIRAASIGLPSNRIVSWRVISRNLLA